jgi:hypothetical protein
MPASAILIGGYVLQFRVHFVLKLDYRARNPHGPHVLRPFSRVRMGPPFHFGKMEAPFTLTQIKPRVNGAPIHHQAPVGISNQ